MTDVNNDLVPEYYGSFVVTRMEYYGRIWQLDWDVEHSLMRLSVVKEPSHGNNTETLSIVAYFRPGHKHYVEGRSLNDTLRAVVVDMAEHTPPSQYSYTSPWEKHFTAKKEQINVLEQ